MSRIKLEQTGRWHQIGGACSVELVDLEFFLLSFVETWSSSA